MLPRLCLVPIAFLTLASCDPSPFEIERPAPRSDAGFDSGTSESQAPGEGRDAGPRDAGPSDAGSTVDAPQAGRAGGSSDNAGASGSTTEQGGAGAAGTEANAGNGGSAGEPAEQCQRADPDAVVGLVEVRDVGTVKSPESIALRIPGQISWIGGKLTWLFPKSIRTGAAATADAAPNQPNAAFVTRDDPTTLEEELDPDGVPHRLLTADEENPATELWPTALLRVPPLVDEETSTGLAFVRVSRDLVTYDVAVGRVSRNATAVQEPLTPLFTESDAKFSTGGFRGNEYGYIFACEEDTSIADRNDALRYPCKIARAKLGELELHDSYRVYDPAQAMWVPDLSAGAPVIYGPPGVLSLSFNNYLGRYIAVHSRWFSNDVVVQSAEMPAGPWRQEFSFTLPTPTTGVVGTAIEQPALIAPDECAKSIWVSYLSPTAETGGYPSAGDVKLVRVELR